MNAAYFHLVLNHIPVLGVLLGLALFLLALIPKSTEVRSVALWVFLLAALSAAPVFLTREPAEDLVERVPECAASLWRPMRISPPSHWVA
jgi:hypothetical protein